MALLLTSTLGCAAPRSAPAKRAVRCSAAAPGKFLFQNGAERCLALPPRFAGRAAARRVRGVPLGAGGCFGQPGACDVSRRRHSCLSGFDVASRRAGADAARFAARAESKDGATTFSFDTGDGKPPKAPAAGAKKASAASAPAAHAAPAVSAEHAAAWKAQWAEAVALAGKH